MWCSIVRMQSTRRELGHAPVGPHACCDSVCREGCSLQRGAQRCTLHPSCLSCAQWIQQADIPEKFVLMSEPDHVWLKPMPNLMRVAPLLPTLHVWVMTHISWRLHAACSFWRTTERETFELTLAGAPPGCFSILLHQPSNTGAEPAADAEVHGQHHSAGGRKDSTHWECAHNDDIRRSEEGIASWALYAVHNHA